MVKKSYRSGSSGKKAGFKHDLGQNFLYDEALLLSLAEGTGVGKENDILEIGPGEGTLTSVLCRKGRRVLSVEVDRDLIPFLRLKEQEFPNLTIVEGDIRKLDFSELTRELEKPYYVIANIPYNITSPILELLWKQGQTIRQMSLMVQKEVSEKLLAQPGQESYCLLSVHCGYYSTPSVIAQVPAACFTPPPNVDSAFVRMDIRPEPLLAPELEKNFFTWTRAGFNLRRKTLVNALKGFRQPERVSSALQGLGLSPMARAEELSVSDWVELTRVLQGEE